MFKPDESSIALPLELSASMSFFEREMVMLALSWCRRHSESVSEVAEMLRVRGVFVSPETLANWSLGNAQGVLNSATPAWLARGIPAFVDELYVKVTGKWRFLYRATDAEACVIDFCVHNERNISAAKQFFYDAYGIQIPIQQLQRVITIRPFK
jgi:transposase-like protein